MKIVPCGGSKHAKKLIKTDLVHFLNSKGLKVETLSVIYHHCFMIELIQLFPVLWIFYICIYALCFLFDRQRQTIKKKYIKQISIYQF